MQAVTHTGERYGRSGGATAFVALGALVAGGVALATPASAAAATHTEVVRASVTSHKATAYKATRAKLAAATRVTTSSVWANAYSVHAGTGVTLTGQVMYGNQIRVQYQPVMLQVRTGNTWKTVATQVLSRTGNVAFTVKPTRSTSYRLSYAGDRALGASASAPTTICVTASSSTRATSVASSAVTSSAVTSAGGRAAQVVAIAAAQSGKAYAFGAAGPNAFDCSGLTQYVFRAVGITLPHQANAQRSYGYPVSRAAARPGDLVFFLSGSYAYHVGIYAGGGYVYDAPNPGQRVGKHLIWTSNVTFRRLV